MVASSNGQSDMTVIKTCFKCLIQIICMFFLSFLIVRFYTLFKYLNNHLQDMFCFLFLGRVHSQKWWCRGQMIPHYSCGTQRVRPSLWLAWLVISSSSIKCVFHQTHVSLPALPLISQSNFGMAEQESRSTILSLFLWEKCSSIN